MRHIYVDDILFGANEIAASQKTREQLVALLRLGRFQLRKWASNSAELLSDINAEGHGLACSKILASNENVKILGVAWSPLKDAFQCHVMFSEIVPITKRSILLVIAKLYDPLGWVTPVTISTKIFVQQLWKAKIGWDETLSFPLLSQWEAIYCRLAELKHMQILRWSELGTLFKLICTGFRMLPMSHTRPLSTSRSYRLPGGSPFH